LLAGDALVYEGDDASAWPALHGDDAFAHDPVEAAAAAQRRAQRAAEGPAPAQALEFHLWPEHRAVLDLFHGVATQWVREQGIRQGLHYPAVRAAPAFRRLPRAQRERIFEDLVVVEHAWLVEAARLRQASQAPALGAGA